MRFVRSLAETVAALMQSVMNEYIKALTNLIVALAISCFRLVPSTRPVSSRQIDIAVELKWNNVHDASTCSHRWDKQRTINASHKQRTETVRSNLLIQLDRTACM